MQPYLFLFLLFFTVTGFAVENDEAAVKRFDVFDLAYRTGEPDAQDKTLLFFKTLNRQTHPRAWIYFHALTQIHGQAKPQLDVQALLSEARPLRDEELTTFLYIVRLFMDESTGTERSLIMEHLKEGFEPCRAPGNDYWCGRLYAEAANYLFGINDLGLGLDYAKRAMERLKNMQGIRRYYIHDTRAILANLLDRSGQSRQALDLMVGNFEWFFAHGYLGDAAVMANNVALKLLRDNDADRSKIAYYVRRAKDIVRIFPNEELATHVNYTQGTLFLRNGQYREGWLLLSQSYEKYMAYGMKVLAYDALISKARAEFELNMESELTRSLELAEPLLRNAYSREALLLLELKYQVARKRKQHEAALALHEELLTLWKKVQKDEDLKQKNRLSIELGLQVEEQRNALLLKQNELNALQLRSAERVKYFAVLISLFFLVTASLLFISFKQTRKIRASTTKIKRILDNIDQGLLTIDSACRIETDYSQKTLAILETGSDIAGRNFEDLAFAHSNLSLETKSIVHEVLRNCLGEDLLAWELNAHNLVSEVEVGVHSKRTLSLRWIPILDPGNHVTSVLVALTDISHERQLCQDLQERNRQLQGLPDKLREILQAPQSVLNGYLKNTKETLAQLAISRDPGCMRQVHTQKGLARTLGLQSISSALHELESSLHSEAFPSTLAHCQRQVVESEAFVSILSQYLTPQGQEGFLWLPSVLGPHLKTWILYASDHGIRFQSLTIKDEILIWSKADLDLIEEVCVHAINNSIDHGFILPSLGGRSIDSPEITIRAYRVANTLNLEIIDNGAGLDMEKLRVIAMKKGLNVSDAKAITDVIFLDEVSTAPHVSPSSGRGIGLAAVKNRIETRRGCIQIRNRSDSHGTQLEAQWPAQAS